MGNITSYVLVHGAGLGGWCWDKVAPIMESQGMTVYAPTLPETCQSLENYIDYIVNFITAKNLQNCCLVGHSYGGMIITGVTDRLKNLGYIENVIFLDAAIPENGDDFASHIPNITHEQAESRRQAFRGLSKDGIWIAPPPAERAGIFDPQDIIWVKSHARPCRLETWLEPIKLKNGGVTGVNKTYILATDPPTDIMGYPIHGAIAKNSREWTYREIPCGHAAMIIQPLKLARLFLE